MLTTDPVRILPFIGPKQSDNLERLGIATIADLLYHIPAYYRDTSDIVTLAELDREQRKTVRVVVEEISSFRIRGGRSMQKGKVGDSSGSIKVTWFNQPFLPKALPVGSEAYLSGKLSPKSVQPELTAPDYELVKENNINLGKIVPIYPLTKGISVKWLRGRMFFLMQHLADLSDLSDPLPQEVREEHELLDLYTALKQVHVPESAEAISSARKRLAFDELLNIYSKLIKARQQRKKARTAKVSIDFGAVSEFIKTIPFKLTPSQVKAVEEIHADLLKHEPMNRLLQGDVGSGKTIVALLAALPVMQSGYQVVIMAPTTVLAQQHYQTIKNLMPASFKIALLTNDTVKKLPKSERYNLIIATHAILFHQEMLQDLGMLVIDEQHRFGVEQRQQLLKLKTKGYTPHLLNLTATPIPRSIALTLFGEIEVSVIERPPGRKLSQTLLVPDLKRSDSYAWLTRQLEAGGQAFWICPLIEPQVKTDSEEEAADPTGGFNWSSDGSELEREETVLKAVLGMQDELKERFPGFKSEILHGKMKAADKDRVIKDFHDHKFQILLSTTVVEVGIDIPGANIILIENAERYGLAQLHQLRGRVGRQNQEAWCLLFSGMETNPLVSERLRYFAKENSGIRIAEFDLARRGPGEVYGTVQSGIPDLKVADFGNSEFMLEVRATAQKMLNYKS